MSDAYDDDITSATTTDAEATNDTPAEGAEQPAPAEPADEQAEATKRFTSCRWHTKQEGGAPYCSHRDVLPYAGMNGFSPEAWCPECTFYKVRRTVKKRRDPSYQYDY